MNLCRCKRVVLTLATSGLLVVGLLWLLNGTCRIARADPGTRYVATDGDDSSVCSDVANPCRTVQHAIDVASAFDEIWVGEGVYTDTADTVATITKTVTLLGGWYDRFDARDPNAHPTTLDARRRGRAVHISGSISPTIDGFTITGGNASNAPTAVGRGGGIYSMGADPVIANNVITNNVAYTGTGSVGQGGGICVEQAPPGAIITGNHVLSNVASTSYHGYGGGIYLGGGSSVQVVNNVVLTNTASITGGRGYGGGIAFSGSSAVLTGNRVEHNVAQRGLATSFGSQAGGIYCASGDDATLSNNIVRHNTGSVPHNGQGGGIAMAGCDRLTVVGNTLQGNVGSAGTMGGVGRGGGLAAEASRDLVIEANWVLSNTARHGGGLYFSRDTTFTMTNNIVAANEASYQGGGMAFETDVGQPVTGTLVNNTFAANNRGSDDGRIAIHVNEPYVALVLTNNLIYSHTYGVYVDANSTVGLYRTLFYANSSGDTGGAGDIANTGPITGQDPLLDADYHLQAGSPAINAGVTVPWLSTDIDGEARPDRCFPDIGADEFITGVDCKHVYLPLVLKSYTPP